MSEVETKSASIGCPFTDGTNNNVKLFTMDTTHLSHPLPDSWAGKYVTVRPFGGNIWVLFNIGNAGVEVDRSIAAAAGGSTDVKVGKYVGLGEERHFELPGLDGMDSTVDLYFNRESDVASGATVYVEVALATGVGDQT